MRFFLYFLLFTATLALPLATHETTLAQTRYERNGSFETDSDGDGIPDEWQPRNLGLGDKIVSEPYIGDSSFRIVGEPGLSKSLRQVIHVDIPRGVLIFFGCTAMTNRWWIADGLFAFKTTLIYGSGKEETFVLEFTQTFDWQTRKIERVTRGRLQKIEVSVIYANRPGKAWFDDVQVGRD